MSGKLSYAKVRALPRGHARDPGQAARHRPPLGEDRPRRQLVSLISAVLFGFILAGSPQAQAQTAPAEVWQVEIAVFSGLESPVFILEPAEVAESRRA